MYKLSRGESNDTPTTAEISDLSSGIVTCWFSLGIQLGVPVGTLTGIQTNYVEFPSPKTKAFQMLRRWQDDGGTRAQLAAALRKEQKGHWAKKFEKMSLTEAQAPNQPHDEKYLDKHSLVDANFAVGAPIVKESIGRIVDNMTRLHGTGFVISKGLIMTCQHVGKDVSKDAAIQFRYLEPQTEGVPGSDMQSQTRQYTYKLRPDIFYYESAELDFAVIAACSSEKDAESLKSIKYINKIESCLPSLRVSIFSHPEGRPMRVALLKEVVVGNATEDLVLGTKRRPVRKETIVHKADTEKGSSGAPIFDDKWCLIGIHQGVAGKKEPRQGEEDLFLNYGTLIKYIIDEMYSRPEQPCRDFEEKLCDHVKDLGVPFPGYCNKLEDIPAAPARAAPRPLLQRNLSSDESGYDARKTVTELNRKDRNILSDKELKNLSREITAIWESLGIELDIEYTTLEGIRNNNIQWPSPEKKAFSMLAQWRLAGGTRQQLVIALRKERMGRLADMFM